MHQRSAPGGYPASLDYSQQSREFTARYQQNMISDYWLHQNVHAHAFPHHPRAIPIYTLPQVRGAIQYMHPYPVPYAVPMYGFNMGNQWGGYGSLGYPYLSSNNLYPSAPRMSYAPTAYYYRSSASQQPRFSGQPYYPFPNQPLDVPYRPRSVFDGDAGASRGGTWIQGRTGPGSSPYTRPYQGSPSYGPGGYPPYGPSATPSYTVPFGQGSQLPPGMTMSRPPMTPAQAYVLNQARLGRQVWYNDQPVRDPGLSIYPQNPNLQADPYRGTSRYERPVDEDYAPYLNHRDPIIRYLAEQGPRAVRDPRNSNFALMDGLRNFRACVAAREALYNHTEALKFRIPEHNFTFDGSYDLHGLGAQDQVVLTYQKHGRTNRISMDPHLLRFLWSGGAMADLRRDGIGVEVEYSTPVPGRRPEPVSMRVFATEAGTYSVSGPGIRAINQRQLFAPIVPRPVPAPLSQPPASPLPLPELPDIAEAQRRLLDAGITGLNLLRTTLNEAQARQVVDKLSWMLHRDERAHADMELVTFANNQFSIRIRPRVNRTSNVRQILGSGARPEQDGAFVVSNLSIDDLQRLAIGLRFPTPSRPSLQFVGDIDQALLTEIQEINALPNRGVFIQYIQRNGTADSYTCRVVVPNPLPPGVWRGREHLINRLNIINSIYPINHPNVRSTLSNDGATLTLENITHNMVSALRDLGN